MTPASKRKTERRQWAKVKGARPPRDKAYLAFIRSLPCIVCQSKCAERDRGRREYFGVRVEAAHVGTRGLGQKCSDYETVPLCYWHHRLSLDSHHVLQKSFWQHHKLDRDAIIAELRRQYEEWRSK